MAKPRTLPAHEVAEQLGVSTPTIYRWALSGELPCLRIGRRVLILREPFERMLSGSKRDQVGPHVAF